jgi:DNA-binding NarL/FixJ family response regulator
MVSEDRPRKTRILIVDDHTILRQGITRLLNTEPDIEVAATSGSVGEALIIVAAGMADVVVLDIDLGPERGTEFLVQVRRNGFTGPVLVLTAGVSEEETEILKAHGVSTFLLKDSSVDQLANHIRTAVGNPIPIQAGSPQPADGLAGGEVKRFTAREARALRLVVEGMSNKEIAAELDSSEPVVKSVLQQLFRKTGTHTRAQLVRVALEQHRGEW